LFEAENPPWGEDLRFVEVFRARRLEHPEWAPWLFRVIITRDRPRRLIGHIGFHLGPDEQQTVEIGYTVFADYRGRGIATEAAHGLITWARQQGIRRVIASIAPANAPSLQVAARLGFLQTGSQWDDEDGEELVLELSL